MFGWRLMLLGYIPAVFRQNPLLLVIPSLTIVFPALLLAIIPHKNWWRKPWPIAIYSLQMLRYCWWASPIINHQPTGYSLVLSFNCLVVYNLILSCSGPCCIIVCTISDSFGLWITLGFSKIGNPNHGWLITIHDQYWMVCGYPQLLRIHHTASWVITNQPTNWEGEHPNSKGCRVLTHIHIIMIILIVIIYHVYSNSLACVYSFGWLAGRNYLSLYCCWLISLYF